AEGVREVSMFVGEVNMSMVEVGKTNEGLMRVVSELMVYSDEIRGAMGESRRGMEEIVRAVYGVKEATVV
ncbi:MAG: hypothetical protein ABDH28_04690, partial [Brevinematia bacterium]